MNQNDLYLKYAEIIKMCKGNCFGRISLGCVLDLMEVNFTVTLALTRSLKLSIRRCNT